MQKILTETKQNIYTKMTQKMTKEELESKENELLILPDLYIRKLRIIEKVHNLRRNFVPRENRLIPSINLKNEKGFSQWDYVLQEVKWMAFDFREERKAKISLAYHCSRRIMKQTKQENIYNQELVLYHKLVSHEMAEIVRNEFQNLSKEIKEPEVEKATMDIEVASVQNDIDVLDLDQEIKRGNSIVNTNPNNSNNNTNNINISGNNLINSATPNLKKIPSIQISSFSIPSNKLKKKGTTNPLKSSQLPIPVIKKQPLLIDYMRRITEFAEPQLAENCCLIDKAQVYENLAKLFKRFPKKSKHLKSNVPDIFNTSAISQLGPNITPFDDNFKSATIPNPAIENSGQKKRKKTNLREDGLKGGGPLMQYNELKKGIDFLNFKKSKNPENFDEVLTLFYNEQKIGEGDYQKTFPNSIEMIGPLFPKTWDEVPTLKFHEMLFEKEFRHCETTFDDEFEKNNEQNFVMLEDFVDSLGAKMDKYYFNRKQLINCDNFTIRRYLERDEISASELIYSFPKLHKNFLVTYSKESHRSKFKLFKEILPNFNDLISLDSHLTRKWPLIMHFLLDRFFNIYGNKWILISDSMNINVLTKNCMITDDVSENKWISFISKKNTYKILDPQTKMFPTRANIFFGRDNPQKNEMIVEELEQNPKRRAAFKKMFEKRKKENVDYEFEKYKECNIKYERKETNFPIYPTNRFSTIFENMYNDNNREKLKEIYEMMEIPGKKQQFNQDTQLSVSRSVNYENFITENDSKLKASLMTPCSYVNSKRKRNLSDKIIPSLIKLVIESKHQQQIRQYSSPNPMPGPPANPNAPYMGIPPHYATKIPLPHAMNQEAQPTTTIPAPPQNYPMHPQMNAPHLPPNNLHMINNMRGVNDPQFANPQGRNFNYMTAPPNPKNPMMNQGRPPQQPPQQPRMNSQEFMTPNNMPNNMGGGMTLRAGPSMGAVNMNNGAVNMGVNRSNVYQLNQINTVNSIKNEHLKMVKKK